jgi:phage shock protein PspC (stress-responsive transcriptional regulator)
MKLYRSTRDKKVFGLCGGLAEVFKIDVTILRLIVLLGIFFSGGAVLLLYILAALVIPKEEGPYSPPPYYGSGNAGSWGYGQPTGFGTTGQPGPTPGMSHGQPPRQPERADSKLDDMMKDIERKALLKEIDELKARLAKLEQDKNVKGDE